ncbi:MAG: hypothetical protein ABIH46_12205 [Chloroflexota bacterium]
MPLGIAYTAITAGAHVDPDSEKPLRAISSTELDMFNGDLAAIASQYTAEPIRALLEKYQLEALTLCRNVMEQAAQPYGGANGLGSEICMRQIRPIDMAYTVQEQWDQDLSAETVGDIWGLQTGGTTPAADTLLEEEGNIILGFIDPVPVPGFEAYQVITGGNRTYPYFTLNWRFARADAIPIAECMAPILEWPEDTVQLQMTVAYLTNPDRTQPIGLHFARARVMVTSTL